MTGIAGLDRVTFLSGVSLTESTLRKVSSAVLSFNFRSSVIGFISVHAKNYGGGRRGEQTGETRRGWNRKRVRMSECFMT